MRSSIRLVHRTNGKRYWITEDGEFAPYIGGGAEPDDPDNDDDDDNDDPDGDDDDDEDKTFTQADVDRIVQKKERKLRRSITRAIEDELGVSFEEAKSIVKQVQDGTKPDAMAEINALRKQLDDREQEIAGREISLVVREKLQEAGVKPARLKRAVRLVELDEDPDDDDIMSAIAELQDDMPELFAVEEELDPDERRPRRKIPSSSSKPPRRKPARREDAFAEGAKLAQQFQASTF